MSKLIESLKAGAKEFTKSQFQAPNSESHAYELTQQQLADIYFSNSKKDKTSELPLVIRVAERSNPFSFLPWLLTSIAFLIAAFSLFSTKRIFVDVRVIDEKNPYFANLSQGAFIPNIPVKNTPSTQEKKDTAVSGTRISLQNVIFEGASKLKSFKNGSEMTLVNSSIASFARANLYFDSPLDLQGSKVVFYAKGRKGGENIAFALKDKDNVLAFHKGEFYPFPAGLSTDWQKAEVSLAGAAENFDPKKVTNIRFEFGSKITQNKPGDTLWIKDLEVAP